MLKAALLLCQGLKTSSGETNRLKYSYSSHPWGLFCHLLQVLKLIYGNVHLLYLVPQLPGTGFPAPRTPWAMRSCRGPTPQGSDLQGTKWEG